MAVGGGRRPVCGVPSLREAGGPEGSHRFVVSFPMLLDCPVDPVVAVRTSMRAVMANPVPMAAWGLIVAVLLVAGAVPLLIGLAVVLPVLGHATWHLYRRVVAW